MCMCVALNPFHTCPITVATAAAAAAAGGSEDKKCCHSSRHNPSQRCNGQSAPRKPNGRTTSPSFRPSPAAAVVGCTEEERTRELLNGAPAVEAPLGSTAARKGGSGRGKNMYIKVRGGSTARPAMAACARTGESGMRERKCILIE